MGKEGSIVYGLMFKKFKVNLYGIDFGLFQLFLFFVFFYENKKINLDFDYFMVDIDRVNVYFFDK